MARGAVKAHRESFDEALARLQSQVGTSQFARPLQPASVVGGLSHPNPSQALTPPSTDAGLKRSAPITVRRYHEAAADLDASRRMAYLRCWEAFQ